MSSRNQLIAVSALVLASLYSAATPVNAADTKPLVPETCESSSRVNRTAGHPGKSSLFPQRSSVQCSRPARKRLTLASFESAPGGKALVSGRTERAIEQIHAKGTVRVTSESLNNLCVAHTVLRQFDEAHETCDAAVTSANAARAKRFRPGVSRWMLDQSASVAYSNRAVMHLLSRNTLAAQNDLASARAISPRAFYVLRNSNAALPAPSLAQASYAYYVSIE